MEIGPAITASQAQMQARFEAAQAERMLSQAQAAAAKAKSAAAEAGQAPDEKGESYQKLLKVSRDFESIFLGYLLKSMRDTVPKGEFLGHSRESEIFGSLRDEELAKKLSEAGGIGLSKLLVDQLKKTL